MTALPDTHPPHPAPRARSRRTRRQLTPWLFLRPAC